MESFAPHCYLNFLHEHRLFFFALSSFSTPFQQKPPQHRSLWIAFIMDISAPLTVSPSTTTTTTSPPPVFEKGHVVVGQSRKKSIKLYYEKTGTGPLLLLYIMGLNSPGCAADSVVRRLISDSLSLSTTFSSGSKRHH